METTRYSANDAINNFILGNKANQYKHVYIDDNAVPCCDMENKIIYSPVLPPTIDNVLDTIIRGKNEHEAGHARFTPSNKKSNWSVTKGELINALEDERIERGLKDISKVFESDLNFLNKFMINKLNTNWQINGCQAQPVRESIIALHMKAMGFTPMWEISSLANDLITSAEPIYFEGKNIGTSTKDFDKVENIADRILAIWENIIKNNTDGNADGNANDNTDGNTDGNADGNTDGNADGNTDGKADGNADGNANDNANDNTDGNTDDNTDGKSKKNRANGRGGADKSLDDYCSGEDLNSILENELKDKIQNSIKELGNYTAYTDEDEIIKSVKNKCYFDKAYQEIAGTISMLASYLEQSLRTQSRCRNIGNRDKGYLDCRALPKLAKNLTKNVFYTQKQGVSLDTTVSILVDESGSMDDKISHCRSLAIAISEVLERLKIKFEILGHTTDYTNKLNKKEESKFSRTRKMVIYEHKNFNENYHTEKYRLGSMNAYNCNIDGEALLVTFKRAMEQRSNRHIILVLSDGQPSGARVGGEQHLCNVVKFCRNNGAEVYAFGIGTIAPQIYYGEDNFIYLPTIKDLNNQFFRQLSNIIVNGKMGK